MRRIAPLSVAALALAGAASEANAAITISVTAAPNFLSGNTTNINSTLAANGWGAFLVTLTSNAAPITTVDFKNDLLSLGGTFGIQAILHQDSKISADDGTTRTNTPSAPGPIGGVATQQGRDSLFLNASYYGVGVPDPFTENNNRVNSANPPYTGSPLADNPSNLSASPPVAGNDFGVGSLMTFTGAAALANASTSVQIAYVIVPLDGSGPNIIRGYAIDGNGNASFVQTKIIIPEPASVGVMALGGLALLARRRKA